MNSQASIADNREERSTRAKKASRQIQETAAQFGHNRPHQGARSTFGVTAAGPVLSNNSK